LLPTIPARALTPGARLFTGTFLAYASSRVGMARHFAEYQRHSGDHFVPFQRLADGKQGALFSYRRFDAD